MNVCYERVERAAVADEWMHLRVVRKGRWVWCFGDKLKVVLHVDGL
jgi:hypothetical protein